MKIAMINHREVVFGLLDGFLQSLVELNFVDNVALLKTSIDSLQNMVEDVSEALKFIGPIISSSKTKVMTFNHSALSRMAKQVEMAGNSRVMILL